MSCDREQGQTAKDSMHVLLQMYTSAGPTDAVNFDSR